MKRLTKFIDSAPYWQVYLVSFILTGLMVFGVYASFGLYTPIVMTKISLAFSGFFSFFFCWTVKIGRDSIKFWETAKEFEAKLDEANTRKELDVLFDTEFKHLCKLASGELHNSELKMLDAIMNTKYKHIQ